MLAFYMDHQFRASVTRGLRRRNIDVLTAFEDGTERIADELLLARATELSRVLVTHDQGSSNWLRIGESAAENSPVLPSLYKNRWMWAKRSNISS